MGENSGDLSLGYMMGQSEGGGGGGFGSFGEGIWAVIILAILFGRGGFGFGGNSGGSGGSDCGYSQAVSQGFALNGLENGIRGVQQGICDSTFALNNSIMSGFHGVDNAICTLGYQTQSAFSNLGAQLASCCCETQRLIERGFCDMSNSINMQTRDIIDNQNANYRGLMDFLVQEKLSTKDAQIAQLQNQLSQSQQNSVIRAAIDASTAEIIRRTGNECPIPAYVVPNPNCCYGNPVGVSYGYGGYGKDSICGCGC